LCFAHEYIDDWDILAEQVIKLIDQQLRSNPQRQIYLCGESFGGCLALKLMAKVPQLFTQVILVNPASSFYQRPWLNLGSYVTKVISDWIYANLTFLLLPFLAKLEALHPRERRALLSAMQSISPQIVSERIDLINNFQVEIELLKRYPHPVLIVASGEDKLLPSVAEAYRLQQIFAQTKISILPDSGHCCLLEKNVDLAQIIQQAKSSSLYQ
jgi:pimeloyl-ACP methyl ester carboxylesterase